jgi:hypothetical protein
MGWSETKKGERIFGIDVDAIDNEDQKPYSSRIVEES